MHGHGQVMGAWRYTCCNIVELEERERVQTDVMKWKERERVCDEMVVVCWWTSQLFQGEVEYWEKRQIIPILSWPVFSDVVIELHVCLKYSPVSETIGGCLVSWQLPFVCVYWLLGHFLCVYPEPAKNITILTFNLICTCVHVYLYIHVHHQLRKCTCIYGTYNVLVYMDGTYMYVLLYVCTYCMCMFYILFYLYQLSLTFRCTCIYNVCT